MRTHTLWSCDPILRGVSQSVICASGLRHTHLVQVECDLPQPCRPCPCAGHDHIYERTCSIFNYTCMADNADGSQGGVTHVVSHSWAGRAPLTHMGRPLQVCERAALDLTCVHAVQVIGNAGYELSWFYNPFYPQYWKKIAIEHGYMRCEVRDDSLEVQ